MPPPRHHARNRGSHAAPPSVARSLIKSFLAVALVATGVGFAQHWRGSGSASADSGAVALPTRSSVPTTPAPTPTLPNGTPTVEATHTARPPRPPTTVAVVPLTVLNNSRVHHLAADTADKFHAAGWPIAMVGNFSGRVAETTAYYEPGNGAQRAAARRLAREFPKITRIAPRFSGLPGHGLTVVLTRYYAA